MPTNNETQVDSIVLDIFHKQGYIDKDIYQKLGGAPTWVKKLFLSKGGTGRGIPEFVVRLAQDKLLIIEDKADESQHSSDPYALDPTKLPELRNAKAYAEDGVLKYGHSAIKSVDVILVAASGMTPKITTFAGNKGGQIARRQEVVLLDQDSYLHILDTSVHPSQEAFRKEAQHIHQEMFDKNIAAGNQELRIRTLLATIVALFEKNFRGVVASWDEEETPKPKTVMDMAKSAIRAYLGSEGCDLDDEKVQRILDIFAPVWKDPSVQTYFGALLVKVLSGPLGTLFSSTSNLDYLGFFYEEFLKYDKAASQQGSITLTPPHIAELMVKLLDLSQDSVVLDSCAGSGTFLISALAEMLTMAGKNEAVRKHIKEEALQGVEIDPQMWAICLINLIFRQDGKNNIIRGDFFDSCVVKELIDKGITHAVLNPPYNNCPHKPMEFFIQAADLTAGRYSVDKNGVLILGKATRRGRIVGIGPTSAFTGYSELRRKFLENNTLLAVIKMPQKLFNSAGVNIDTCVFVAETGKSHPKDAKVWFANLSDDGYVMHKLVRIDRGVRGKEPNDQNPVWPGIRDQWLQDFSNKIVKPGEKSLVPINEYDEWCYEAHIDTDYTKLTRGVFEGKLTELALYLIPVEEFIHKLPDFSKYEPLIKEFPQLLYLPVEEFIHMIRDFPKLLDLPVEEFIPTLEKLLASAKPISDTLPALTNWKHFKLFDLFTLVRGSSLTKNQAEEKTGTYPFLSASRYNNGETARTGDWGEEYQRFCGHCLAIVANGAPGYAFYQVGPFYASVDIVIARPKVEVSVHALLFVATVITNERYRFNYGRKFTGARQNLNLWLPAKEDGTPNWDLMDQYMKGLRFSSVVPTPAVL